MAEQLKLNLQKENRLILKKEEILREGEEKVVADMIDTIDLTDMIVLTDMNDQDMTEILIDEEMIVSEKEVEEGLMMIHHQEDQDHGTVIVLVIKHSFDLDQNKVNKTTPFFLRFEFDAFIFLTTKIKFLLLFI